MMPGIGLVVVTVAVALFMDKQVSYALDGDKDLFVFLGLVVNLPYLVHLYRPSINAETISTEGVHDKQ